MPTKSKPFKANQRASRLLPASVKSFVSPFPPRAVRRQRRQGWGSATSRDICTCSFIPRKPTITPTSRASEGGLLDKKVEGGGAKRSKANWLIASPVMMSAWINVSHRHANQLHDIITASITPVGHQSYSKDNITQHLKPQETSTTLLDVL